MFRRMNKTREFLRANKESHGAAPGGLSGSADPLAGDKPLVDSGENPFKTDAPATGGEGGGGRAEQAQHFADHHQKLADHFRQAATSQPGDEAESLMEAAGETPADELLEGDTGKGPSSMAAHHQKMADHHRGLAAAEGSPEEEAGELPDFEATEDETPQKASAVGAHADVETPGEESGEAPGFETEEDLAAKKKGGSLRNAKGGNPLSRFNAMRKGKK